MIFQWDMANTIKVVGGVFYRLHPQIEIQLFRKTVGALQGLYEFPGGKIELSETPQGALKREIQEELGIEIVVQDFIGRNSFITPTAQIELSLYLMEVLNPKASIQMKEHDHWIWQSQDLKNLPEIAPGDQPLLAACFQKIRTKI